MTTSSQLDDSIIMVKLHSNKGKMSKSKQKSAFVVSSLQVVAEVFLSCKITYSIGIGRQTPQLRFTPSYPTTFLWYRTRKQLSSHPSCYVNITKAHFSINKNIYVIKKNIYMPNIHFLKAQYKFMSFLLCDFDKITYLCKKLKISCYLE